MSDIPPAVGFTVRLAWYWWPDYGGDHEMRYVSWLCFVLMWTWWS